MSRFTLLLLTACQVEPAALPAAAAPAAAPGLHLGMSPLVTNEVTTWRVEGAPPGGRVGVYMSRYGIGSWCPPGLGGFCLDLQPHVYEIGRTVAAGDGSAIVTRVIPDRAQFVPGFHFQAIAEDPATHTWASSERVHGNAIGRFIQPIALTIRDGDLTERAITLGQGRLGYEPGVLQATSITIDNDPGGISVVDAGDGTLDVTFDVDAIDWNTLNPMLLDVTWSLDVNGVQLTWEDQWAVGAVPDRVAMMWTGSQLFLKTRSVVEPSASTSIYFGFSDVWEPDVEVAPGTWRLRRWSGGATPSFNQLNLMYFSHHTTPYPIGFNESYFNTFSSLGAGAGYSASARATGTTGFDGRIYWMDPVDRDGDTDVDGLDLAAVSLDAL